MIISILLYFLWGFTFCRNETPQIETPHLSLPDFILLLMAETTILRVYFLYELEIVSIKSGD